MFSKQKATQRQPKKKKKPIKSKIGIKSESSHSSLAVIEEGSE